MLLILIVVFSIIVSAQEKSVDAEKKVSLKEGMEAPDFTLKDSDGNEYTLSDYRGESPVVVYFYPKAGTSGCTKQACGIRDDWSKFQTTNIQVFGISTDSPAEIKKFIADYNLNFPLLSDQDKEASKAYGVLKESGTDKRVTFIVDKEGKIARIIEVKDIEHHSEQVFDIASKLN